MKFTAHLHLQTLQGPYYWHSNIYCDVLDRKTMLLVTSVIKNDNKLVT